MAPVVLDTNVVVQACLTPQCAAATIVELALLGTFTLCMSPGLLGESVSLRRATSWWNFGY
jgi:predicted nucleic acid-binding protein